MERTYIYYVKYSVYCVNPSGKIDLLTVNAGEFIMEKRIKSFKEIEELIEFIKFDDEIDDEDIVSIDFYCLLRVETTED